VGFSSQFKPVRIITVVHYGVTVMTVNSLEINERGEDLCLDDFKYAFFDGDNVGNTLENLLASGRISEASHLSESIKLAIFQIELLVKTVGEAEILIAGGDDILIIYNSKKHDLDFLHNISNLFSRYTGLSMSCGIGNDVDHAIANLSRAKQYNKGSITSEVTQSNQYMHLMKCTNLYIFSTSENPDPYINVMAHCVANYENLNQVFLLGITGDRRKVSLERDKLERLKQNIDEQLDSLVSRKYLRRKGKDIEEVEIEIESIDCQTYSRLKDLDISIKALIFDDLEQEISKLLSSEDSILHVFDVTTVLKSYLVDIYTILRFRNISSIYSFELFNKRSYDDKELIHNQEYKKNYDFVCLATSSHTSSKIIVGQDSVISESEFNKLQSEIHSLKADYNSLEDTLANDFARFFVFAYFLLLMLYWVWSCWNIFTQPEGWNRVEPISFLITLAWVLASYLLQVLFTGRFPEVDPRGLFKALIAWRKRRLNRQRKLDKN
jgi:hypothetical protein